MLLHRYIAFLLLGLTTSCLFAQSPKAYSRSLSLMGSTFEVTAVSTDDRMGRAALQQGIAEIQRIEALISSWDSASQTSAINRNAGSKAVKVNRELFDLIARCLKVSKLTSGAFDITFAATHKIWVFDGEEQPLPDSPSVRQSLAPIGWQKVVLNPDSLSVFLPEAGMRIGFGAIGKGYAANRAKASMIAAGAHSGLVNAGGDLLAWGEPPQGGSWRIGIADPKNREHIFAWLNIKDLAVVTSGNYEKFFTFEGKRYGHIIDPRTGYPATGLKSVTVVCPDAELADALATGIFVLGAEKGMALVNQLKGIECLLVTDQDELLTSEQLHINYYSEATTAPAPLHQTIIGTDP